MKGRVTRFSDYHGYGFIKGEDANDYFVHYSCIIGQGFKSLSPFQEVEFEPYETEKGWQAHDIRRISSSVSIIGENIVLKRNPFTPQDPIVDPKKFAGRREPFTNAVDSLFSSP
jgi:CspA family cold shock protein